MNHVSMFVPDISILEKVVRTIAVYAFLLIGLRLAGKREMSQLNSFDLVVLLLLSNTVQNAIIGDDNTVTGGIIGAVALLTINYAVVRFLYDHRKLDQLVEGKADVLIEDGRIHLGRLKKELITLEELAAAARKQGFDSLSEIQKCILEPGGTLCFIGKKPGTEDLRHHEILEGLASLRKELALLKGMRGEAKA